MTDDALTLSRDIATALADAGRDDLAKKVRGIARRIKARVVWYVEVDYGRGERRELGFFWNKADAEAVQEEARDGGLYSGEDVKVGSFKPCDSIEEFRKRK